MDCEQFIHKILKEEQANIFPELTGSIIHSLDDAVRSCLEYYNANPASEHVLEVRTCISKKMEEFHKKAGTYSNTIQETIEDLSNPNALVVEVAHQPNIFPYIGYFKKIVLGHEIAEKIRGQVNFPVVELFGIVDQDFACPKWFRTTYLPDINAKEGHLVLKAPVSKDSIDAMYSIEKPSQEHVNKWKGAIETWLTNNARVLNRLTREIDGNLALGGREMAVYRERMNKLFQLIDECTIISQSLTEFNSFFISKLVNSIWKYPMLFYEYHTTQNCFLDDYLYLTKEFEKYNTSFNNYYEYLCNNNISLNFTRSDITQAPFWIHCDCGAKLEANIKTANYLKIISLECKKCKNPAIEINLKDLSWGKISPRAAARPIVIASGLKPSIFVSGLGATGFEMISRGIANDFDIKLPPYVIWHKKDNYAGIAQEVARKMLEINPEEEINKRCDNAIGLMPSIIDYLINIGFEETKNYWGLNLENLNINK